MAAGGPAIKSEPATAKHHMPLSPSPLILHNRRPAAAASTLCVYHLTLFPLSSSISHTAMASHSLTTLLTLILSFSLLSISQSSSPSSPAPITPRSFLLRYWARKITNDKPRPAFFVSKLSPLSPVAFAAFSSLSPSDLSSNLPSFCSSAHLACDSLRRTSSSLEAHKGPSAFTTYTNSNFTNYATKSASAATSFSNYSAFDGDLTVDTFRRYSRASTNFTDSFSAYSLDTDGLVTTNFTSYSSSSHSGSGQFSTYHRNANGPELKFTSYDRSAVGPTDRGFENYAANGNSGDENFASYSKDGEGVGTAFARYSELANVINTGFKGYAEKGKGANDSFASYGQGNNDPTLKFSSYDADGKDADRDFASYNMHTNGGDENFTSYGKKGDGLLTAFTHYSNETNVGTSEFSGYGQDGNGAANNFTSYGDFGNDESSEFLAYGVDGKGANNTFTSYGDSGNLPEQGFQAYGSNADGGSDSFTSYRNQSSLGDDAFISYGKKGTGGHKTEFANYGRSIHEQNDSFTAYGEGSHSDVFNFTSYFGQLASFKGYENKEKGNKFSFTSYANASAVPRPEAARKEMTMGGGGSANRWVEPGKFFRESELMKGTVMPMPDIRDKMPPRSFLPRSIAAKIPFSAGEVRRTFKLPADTAMGKAVGDTVAECERAPSRGETKRCAASAEDMIDFAVTVLGSDVVVRSTENTRGSKGSIVIGEVRGVNGGKVTQSVSCHQSLFPYLVYYCHSVPKVRVYEADILAVDGGKINRGVAICHIDTSDWSVGHGAFVVLGSAPGKIEVCHWIFEGDMTWATAD